MGSTVCRLGHALGALGLLAGWAGMPGVVAAEAPPPVRVLILSGRNNHDWQSTTPVIRAMFAACSRFGRVDVTDDPARLDRAALAGWDVLVSNWTPYPDTRRLWPAATETAFLEFVREGGGFVVIHAAACTFQVWPEFQDLIALTWKADYTGHGAYHTFRVAAAQPEHPIAQGLGDFYTTDELYHNMVHLSEAPYEVVFTAFSAQDRGGTGKAEPVLVCTSFGRGRGANLVLGHDAAAMGAGFRTLLLRSAEWAATGKVTLPPPPVWPSTPEAMAAADVDIEAALAAAARFHYGDPRRPLAEVECLTRCARAQSGQEATGFRRQWVARLGAVLTAPETPADAKAFFCGQFALVAGEEHAPLLTPLLTGADGTVAQAALGALARIPGPRVDALLRDAVPVLRGDLRLGAVRALGERRDDDAIGMLSALLASGDEALAGAAAGALGAIGSEAAAEALRAALAEARGSLRATVADACLACAERRVAEGRTAAAVSLYRALSGPGEGPSVRMAALRGLALADPGEGVGLVCKALASGDPALESMALQLVPQVPGARATAEFAGCLDRVPEAVRPLLLRALAVRGDGAAREAVAAAAAGPEPAVRMAALEALGTLGDATTADLLLDRVLAGPETAEGAAARESLLRLPRPDTDRRLVARLGQGPPEARVELARLLAARQAPEAVPGLEEAAADAEPAVRRAAWKALGALAGAGDARTLAELLARARDEERPDAEKALAAVLSARGGVEDLAAALAAPPTPAALCSLLRVAGSLGDDRLLPAVRQAAASPDPAVRDAAIRGLAGWPTPAPFEDLVALAGKAAEPAHRVLALRGATRLSSQAAGRGPEQMTRLIADLLPLAGNAADRKALLAELGRCPTPEALALARASLGDPELAVEAGVAVTQIAGALRDTHREQVLEALGSLMDPRLDPAVTARAGRLLEEVLRPANLALGAAVTSPDNVDPDGASGGDAAAIDGDPRTYWDETDGCAEYRLRVTLPEPREVVAIDLLWHPHEPYQARNLDVLCDGALALQVRDRRCLDNGMFLLLAPVRCTTVELVIPGRNGLVSPAIHELRIFGRDILPQESTR